MSADNMKRVTNVLEHFIDVECAIEAHKPRATEVVLLNRLTHEVRTVRAGRQLPDNQYLNYLGELSALRATYLLSCGDLMGKMGLLDELRAAARISEAVYGMKQEIQMTLDTLHSEMHNKLDELNERVTAE